ncbi:MAG: HIT family protein [Rhizobiaceae bacterium]
MSSTEYSWQLDSRLNNDTIPVFDNGGVSILLMNDRRWPWLILVPKVVGAEELHDLGPEIAPVVMDIAISTGEKLKSMTGCEKINIAAIGNMVRQLHIHVIARSEGDANWPGPVWGYGSAEPYNETEASDLIGNLKEQLFDPSIS